MRRMAVALLGGAALLLTSAGAEAARCDYVAIGEGGKQYAYGIGYAFKRSHACNRARRTCNRRLGRARRFGKVPRGISCVLLREGA
jgi:hypothetical protein